MESIHITFVNDVQKAALASIGFSLIVADNLIDGAPAQVELEDVVLEVFCADARWVP